MKEMHVNRTSFVILATIFVLTIAVAFASNLIAYQFTSFGLKLSNAKLSIQEMVWYHIVFVPSLSIGIRLASLSLMVFSLLSIAILRKTNIFPKKRFFAYSLLIIIGAVGTGLTAIPTIQASIATGSSGIIGR